MIAPPPRTRHLRLGLVGTYPPRACGLATFTADVGGALADLGHHVEVVALVDGPDDAVDPPVRHRLVRTDPGAHRAVAATLSATTDVVLIQHEFGIFGGPEGLLLAELTDALTVPYALVLHTVTGRFTPDQHRALARPLRDAASILVFTDEAGDLLADQFHDVRDRCHVVPHGAPPELYGPRRATSRATLGLADDASVVTTFGLLSPGKGIEDAISAVASLRHAVDGLVYVVAGRTHPEVVRRHGEGYRRQLVAQVAELGLDDVVVFRDWFHDVPELAHLLAATDVFVTPYSGAEQIVSGALSFAVAAGVPFVSTPYRYARDLARRGCGVVVPFDRPDALATGLKELLADTEVRRSLSDRARQVGTSMSWPFVARQTADLLADLVAERGGCVAGSVTSVA